MIRTQRVLGDIVDVFLKIQQDKLRGDAKFGLWLISENLMLKRTSLTT